MKTEITKFGWFMNGCYATSLATAILLDTTFIVPFWIYIVLIAGLLLTIIFQRDKIENGKQLNN